MNYRELLQRLNECRDRYRYLALWNLEKGNEGQDLKREIIALNYDLKRPDIWKRS